MSWFRKRRIERPYRIYRYLGGECLPVRVRDRAVARSRRRRRARALPPRPVADHQNDFGRVVTVRRGVDQRLQVRSAARNQNADFEPWLEPFPGRCHGASASTPGMRCRKCPHGPAVDGVPAKTALSPRTAVAGAANITGSGPSCNEFAMTLPPVPARAGMPAGGLPIIEPDGRLSCRPRVGGAGARAASAPSGPRNPIRSPRRSPSTPPPTPSPRPATWRAPTASAARFAMVAERLAGGTAPSQAAKARRQDDHRPRPQLRGGERAHVGGALCRRLHLPFPTGGNPARAAKGRDRRRRRTRQAGDPDPGHAIAGATRVRNRCCGQTQPVARGLGRAAPARAVRCASSCRWAMPAISPRSMPTRRAPAMPGRLPRSPAATAARTRSSRLPRCAGRPTGRPGWRQRCGAIGPAGRSTAASRS